MTQSKRPPYATMNGKIMPYDQAKISIMAPGLTFAVLTAGVTYAAMSSIGIAVTAGLAVLLAIWVGRLVSRSGDEKDEPAAPEIVEESYVARVRSEPLPKDSPQATEIERLVRRRIEDRNGDSKPGSDRDPGRATE